MGLHCYWKKTSRCHREGKCWVQLQNSFSLSQVLFFGLRRGVVLGIGSGRCVLQNCIDQGTWCDQAGSPCQFLPLFFLTSPLFALPSWALQEVHMSLRLLSPNGTTVSSGVFTPAVDRSVTMHNPRYKFLSQLCCGSGIQIRVSGWPLFGRKIGRSLFTCQRGFYVLFWIQQFVLLHT